MNITNYDYLLPITVVDNKLLHYSQTNSSGIALALNLKESLMRLTSKDIYNLIIKTGDKYSNGTEEFDLNKIYFELSGGFHITNVEKIYQYMKLNHQFGIDILNILIEGQKNVFLIQDNISNNESQGKLKYYKKLITDINFGYRKSMLLVGDIEKTIFFHINAGNLEKAYLTNPKIFLELFVKYIYDISHGDKLLICDLYHCFKLNFSNNVFFIDDIKSSLEEKFDIYFDNDNDLSVSFNNNIFAVKYKILESMQGKNVGNNNKIHLNASYSGGFLLMYMLNKNIHLLESVSDIYLVNPISSVLPYSDMIESISTLLEAAKNMFWQGKIHFYFYTEMILDQNVFMQIDILQDLYPDLLELEIF